MKRKTGILLYILIIITLINSAVFAANIEQNIYFEGKKIENISEFKDLNGEIYIKSRFLANLMDAELRWHKSIQLLEMKKDNKMLKMMVGNPYLQIDNTTIKVENGLLFENGHTYLPFKKTLKAFDYMYTNGDKSQSIYVFKPENMVNEITYNKDENNIKISMEKKVDYEIKKMDDDPTKLLIRLRRATLSGDFRDELTGDDFKLEINRSSDKVYLEMIVDSKKTIPFDPVESIRENESNLIIDFISQLENISWTDNDELEISASGKIGKFDVFHLEKPRRMVIDIPSVMINNYNNNLKENDYINDIRVSQFKYDPMILRVVLELKGNKLFEVTERNNNSILLQKKGELRLSNFDYSKSMISFMANKSIEPKLFTLSKPDRLVIDIPSALKDDSFKDMSLKNGLINEIRTSKFDEDTTRIVADLEKSVNFRWVKERNKNGYMYTVYLNNSITGIEITDEKSYNNIDSI